MNNVAWSVKGDLASSSFPSVDFLSSSVIIWELTTGKPVKELEATAFDKGLAWSPDGQLATLSATQITIWDISTGKPIQTLNSGKSIFEISWAKDGRLASTSDNNVIIWDIQTAKPAQTLKGHTFNVNNLAWSTDGFLASASNNEVIIWDPTSAKPLTILMGHTNTYFGRIKDLLWLSDGRLVSSSDDKTIKISRGDILRIEPCEWISRNMTIREWAAYQGELYIYKPACSNLPYPTFSSLLTDNPGVIGYTWLGRIILIAVFALLITILFFVVQKVARKIFKM